MNFKKHILLFSCFTMSVSCSSYGMKEFIDVGIFFETYDTEKEDEIPQEIEVFTKTGYLGPIVKSCMIALTQGVDVVIVSALLMPFLQELSNQGMRRIDDEIEKQGRILKSLEHSFKVLSGKWQKWVTTIAKNREYIEKVKKEMEVKVLTELSLEKRKQENKKKIQVIRRMQKAWLAIRDTKKEIKGLMQLMARVAGELNDQKEKERIRALARSIEELEVFVKERKKRKRSIEAQIRITREIYQTPLIMRKKAATKQIKEAERSIEEILTKEARRYVEKRKKQIEGVKKDRAGLQVDKKLIKTFLDRVVKNYTIYKTKDSKSGPSFGVFVSKQGNKDLDFYDLNQAYLDSINFKNLKIEFKNIKPGKVDMKSLRKIFKGDGLHKGKIVYLNGHGGLQDFVAQLTIDQYVNFINSLLPSINCKFLFVSSCYGYGLKTKTIFKRLARLQDMPYQEAKIAFPIAVGAISDSAAQIYKDIKFRAFFDGLHEFFSLGTLSEEIYLAKEKPISLVDIMGYVAGSILENTVLVKLPGLRQFYRPVNVDNKLLVITYPYILAHELRGAKDLIVGKEKPKKAKKKKAPLPMIIVLSPIRVEGKDAILLYPTVLMPTLEIVGNKALALVSMFPGDAHHFIKKVEAKEINFYDIIKGFFSELQIRATKLFLIDEIVCKDKKVKNVVIETKYTPSFKDKDKEFFIKIMFTENGEGVEAIYNAKKNDFDENRPYEYDRFSIAKQLSTIIASEEAYMEATGARESNIAFINAVKKYFGLFKDTEEKSEQKTRKYIGDIQKKIKNIQEKMSDMQRQKEYLKDPMGFIKRVQELKGGSSFRFRMLGGKSKKEERIKKLERMVPEYKVAIQGLKEKMKLIKEFQEKPQKISGTVTALPQRSKIIVKDMQGKDVVCVVPEWLPEEKAREFVSKLYAGATIGYKEISPGKGYLFKLYKRGFPKIKDESMKYGIVQEVKVDDKFIVEVDGKEIKCHVHHGSGVNPLDIKRLDTVEVKIFPGEPTSGRIIRKIEEEEGEG